MKPSFKVPASCVRLRRRLAIPTLLALAGCATMKVESSPPGAAVGIIAPGDTAITQIGQTPFEARLAEYDHLTNGGPVTLVISKRGFLSQHFVLPNLPHTDLKLNTALLPDLPHNYEEMNRVVALVLKGQRHLLEKRYDEALKAAAQIKELNENIASSYEIEGAVHYLRNDLRDARFAWMRVVELEPMNHEAKGMLSLVETRMGMKAPAGNRVRQEAEAPAKDAREPAKDGAAAGKAGATPPTTKDQQPAATK